MKREILFKAKREFYGNWIEGMPTCDNEYLFNSDGMDSPDNYKIDSETICQFTGLTDKNGVKIFEGDIVRHLFESECIHDEIKEVYFDNELLEFGLKNSSELFNCQFSDEFSVVGNIFDNPELLF